MKDSRTITDYLIFLILFLLGIEYTVAFIQFGMNFQSFNFRDSLGYIDSGIFFSKTGIVTMYDAPHPTAFIMPLFSLFIGALSRIAGEGIELWIAVRISSIVFSVATAYVIYRSVRLFDETGWFALFSVWPCFCPNIASINNFVMTEPLFRFFFAVCIFYTLYMGRRLTIDGVLGFSVTFTLALMLRANILPLPLFSFAYVYFLQKGSVKAYVWKKVLSVFTLVVLCFVLPWTIRNYIHFHALVPLTYGASDPLLASSSLWPDYSGPTDSSVSMQSEEIFQEEYSDYYSESGTLIYPHSEQYLMSRLQLIEAKSRLSTWISESPLSSLNYYLISKPLSLLNWVYYPTSAFGADYEVVHSFARINLLLCVLSVALAVLSKNYLPEICFLSGTYLVFLLLISTSYAIDRYTFPFSVLRYILAGLLPVIARTFLNQRNKTPEKPSYAALQ